MKEIASAENREMKIVCRLVCTEWDIKCKEECFKLYFPPCSDVHGGAHFANDRIARVQYILQRAQYILLTFMTDTFIAKLPK